MGKLLRAELLELFFHEVESYIPEMQRCLDLLTKDNSSKVALEELYRYFHNIKGASSQVKLVKVSEVAKQLELFIEEKIELKQTVDQHALDNLVRVLDVLKTFAQAQDGSTEAEEVVLGEYAQTFGDSNNDDITHSEQVSRQIEIESLHSGLGAARRILPLLKEMAECLLPTANSVESVNEIYNRLSEAVSLIAAAVNKAGMPRQGELLHELDHLLDQVTQGRVKHQPEMSGLFCDFFQYLEVIYSLEQPEQDELVLRVDEQLALIYSVFGLSRGQQAEAAHMSIVEDSEQVIAELFEQPSEEDESIAFMEQLDDSELLNELSQQPDLDEIDLFESDEGDGEIESLFDSVEEVEDDSESLDAAQAEFGSESKRTDEEIELVQPEESSAGRQTSQAKFAAGQLGREEDFPESEKQLLFEIFQEECDEHLIVINQSLNFLEGQVGDSVELSPPLKNCLREMRRAVHTLKGAASVTGVQLLAKGAHSIEDMLDWLHDSANEINPEEVQLLGSGIDLIETLAQDVDSTESAGLNRYISSIDEYLAFSAQRTEKDDAESIVHVEDELPAPVDSYELSDKAQFEIDEAEISLPGETGSLRVKLEDLDELQSIEGELVVARGAMERMVEEFSQTLIELDNVKDNLRRKSQELETGFEVQALYGFNPAVQSGGGKELSEDDLIDFDPIELDRYSQLNLIIRSLNEISVDVSSISSTLSSLNTNISSQIGKQQLTMRLMQDKLMRIRMTPLSSISRLLFRTVRETATALGKKVNLIIKGEDVYMDRFVWAKVTDPLLHLLRNSVDHGIEMADMRKTLGKSETGTITLEVEQGSRNVILRLSDDGAGVDVEALEKKLQASGFINERDELSEPELLDYLFKTSFSTKEDISTVSGRGVGLDVVKSNIQDIRGSVKVINDYGRGVTFELFIPSSLSVNRAVFIKAANREFAVPLQDIQQVKFFPKEDIDDSAEATIRYRDTLVPFANLGFYLQLEPLKIDLPQGADGLLTLLFQKGEKQYAVSIDAVVDQREIIIKNLGSHLTHVQGISGVTLTGSGGVVPILNLNELVEKKGETEAFAGETPAQIDALEPLKVMIVDDSISVRHSIARLVEGQGWVQLQAIDGMDALAKLETFTADVIILDVEMPRMNGYEFKSNINNRKNYKDIPVIMLTSRSSEKHRQKGLELGVDHYLTKPYQEEAFIKLLEEISSRKLN